MKNKNHIIKRDLKRLKDDLAMTAKDMRGQAKDAFTDTLESAREKSADLQVSVANYVGEKPFKALGIAMLSGYVLAVAMRRKRRHRFRNSHE